MAQQKRQTAYKVWLANLVNGRYIKQQGEWDPNYVLVNETKVSRVNILAIVIGSEFGENVGSLTLDDGSATIQVRSFKEDVGLLRDVKVGDVVLIIGRPREFQNNLYVTAEIIKKVDNPAWMTVRKLELTKLFGEPQKVMQPVAPPVAEPIVVTTTSTPQSQPVPATPATETGRQKVLNIVEKAAESGLTIEEVITQSSLPEADVDGIVQELLKDGEIYMPKPGQVKIV